MLQPGETILNGKYRIVEFLGKGAFAHVYRARHEALKRDVAVKVLRRDMEGADSTRLRQYRQRFQLEAELGAQFDDPHLVKVYDFEEEDGALYLVMEYCPGGSLEKRLEKGPLSVEEAVRMMREVAQGLALLHGHRPQVVHRDLKPSNILLGADGVWKVADLGLSQVPRRTSVRSVLGSEAERHPGTPEYMSPEQEETVGYLQPPSDVWALGAVVFEALTGRLYKGERPGVRVRELREDVPGWLDELVARCLEKEKEARPWDGGEVVRAVEEGLAREGEDRRAVEEAARRAVEEAARREREARVRQLKAGVSVALARGDRAVAWQLVGEMRGLDPAEAERVEAEVREWEVSRDRGVREEGAGRRGGVPIWVALGILVALGVAVPLGWGLGLGGQATPAPTVAAKVVATAATPAPRQSDAVSPVQAEPTNAARAKSTATWAPTRAAEALAAVGTPAPRQSDAVSPVQAEPTNAARAKSTATWASTSTPVLPTAIPSSASPPSHTPPPTPFVVVVSEKVNLRVGPGTNYDRVGMAQVGDQFALLGKNPASDWWEICCVDGRAAWVAGSVVQVEGATDTVPTSRNIPPSPTPVPATPTSTVPAEAPIVTVANAHQVRLLLTFSNHSDKVRGVAFTPDGSIVASADDHAVLLWTVDGMVLQVVERIQDAWLSGLAISPDEMLLAASFFGPNMVRVWSVREGAPRNTLTWPSKGVAACLSFSPDGTVLAVGEDYGGGDENGTLLLWRVSDMEMINRHESINEKWGGVRAVSFSPDSTVVVGGMMDGRLRAWRVADGHPLFIANAQSQVNTVAFSPSGEVVVSGSADGKLRLWRVTDGALIRTLEGHTGQVEGVAFSPDGSILASASDDSTVRLWRVSDGGLLHTLRGHSGVVWSVAFSPDGRIIASGGWDKTVRLWGVLQ